VKLLVVRYGEIALKGKNRSYFETRLLRNIKAFLVGVEDITVTRMNGRIYIEHNDYDYDEVVERVTRVFGVVSVSPVDKGELEMEAMFEIAHKQMEQLIEELGSFTFKVETRRSNKGFELKSPEISRRVGGYLNQTFEPITVEVHKPQVTINIEVREKVYIYSHKIAGPGGMPYGTAGKGLLLLSGGIDSPVAGWMMAKRGIRLEAVHYHSYPFTSDRAKEKVMDLARILTKYTERIKVHSVNLLEIQKAINEHCPSSEMTILSRRFMMGIAEQIGKQRGCQALITGESLGQVASQTIEGLTVTNSKVDLPVLRPLIAMDKVDIIKVAENIGTFETSILPFEDCCTVFLPEKVVTKPKVKDIEASENLIDVEGLIAKAIEEKEVFTFVCEEYVTN